MIKTAPDTTSKVNSKIKGKSPHQEYSMFTLPTSGDSIQIVNVSKAHTPLKVKPVAPSTEYLKMKR